MLTHTFQAMQQDDQQPPRRASSTLATAARLALGASPSSAPTPRENAVPKRKSAQQRPPSTPTKDDALVVNKPTEKSVGWDRARRRQQQKAGGAMSDDEGTALASFTSQSPVGRQLDAVGLDQARGVTAEGPRREEGAAPPPQPMAIDAFGSAPRAVIADVAAAQPLAATAQETCFVDLQRDLRSVKLPPSTSILGPAGGDGELLAFKISGGDVSSCSIVRASTGEFHITCLSNTSIGIIRAADCLLERLDSGATTRLSDLDVVILDPWNAPDCASAELAWGAVRNSNSKVASTFSL